MSFYSQFSDNMVVYCSNFSKDYKARPLNECLPNSFGPKDLGFSPEDLGHGLKKNGIKKNGLHNGQNAGDQNGHRVY